MKTTISRQKSIFKIILLLLIFVIGSSDLLFSQTQATSQLAKFSILIESTNDEIRLTSQEGCDWKKLSFTLQLDKLQAVDKRGMVSLKGEKSNNGGFLFTITKTKDGVSLEGLEGTAWKKLSFSCSKSRCYQLIDQFGMTEMK